MGISTAVAASERAFATGIATVFRDLRGGAAAFLAQRIAVFGQGNTGITYSTIKKQIFSALAVANEFGFGSPLHIAVLQLLPDNGDGVGTIPVTIYPLEEGALATVSTGDITPTGVATAAGEFRVVAGGIRSNAFAVAIGDTVADFIAAAVVAVNATSNTVIVAADGTTKIDATSKWKGLSANSIVLEIEGPTDVGFSFAYTQPVGGTVNPTVDDALSQIGNIWETMLVNCLDADDTTALDTISGVGEGRWGALVHKPLMSFVGENVASPVTAIVIPDARKSDRTNSQLVNPGSNDLPCMIAARQVARIAVVANRNPAMGYVGQKATGLTPGTDGEQWDNAKRSAAFAGGSSTALKKDGVMTLGDTITFHHPTGDAYPAYRYVKDIVRLQTILYNLALIFENVKWAAAPIIPDDQATADPDAKKPKDAKAECNALIYSLATGPSAILSDYKTAQKLTRAEIDGSNPNRLNVAITVQLSGNSLIKSITLNYGFYFGSSEAA